VIWLNESAGKHHNVGTGTGNNWLRTVLLEYAWAADHSLARVTWVRNSDASASAPDRNGPGSLTHLGQPLGLFLGEDLNHFSE